MYHTMKGKRSKNLDSLNSVPHLKLFLMLRLFYNQEVFQLHERTAFSSAISYLSQQAIPVSSEGRHKRAESFHRSQMQLPQSIRLQELSPWTGAPGQVYSTCTGEIAAVITACALEHQLWLSLWQQPYSQQLLQVLLLLCHPSALEEEEQPVLPFMSGQGDSSSHFPHSHAERRRLPLAHSSETQEQTQAGTDVLTASNPWSCHSSMYLDLATWWPPLTIYTSLRMKTFPLVSSSPVYH